MIIRGNVLCVNIQRTDYLETDPAQASYLINRPAEDIEDAKQKANDALPKTGGTMTGDIAMSGNKVTGIAEPTMHTDAATKGYVDSRRKVFHVTLTAAGWVGDAAPFAQVIAMEGILETDTPHYGPVYSESAETALLEKENWALVDDLNTADGSVTFTCLEEKPAVDVTVQMEVFR